MISEFWQNSAVISEFWQNSAEKQNSKQNFDFETRIGVDNETKFCCDIRILTNSAGKAKF